MAKLKIISQATKDVIDSLSDFNRYWSPTEMKKYVDERNDVYKRIDNSTRLKRDLIDANKNISDSKKNELKERVKKEREIENLYLFINKGAE